MPTHIDHLFFFDVGGLLSWKGSPFAPKAGAAAGAVPNREPVWPNVLWPPKPDAAVVAVPKPEKQTIIVNYS